MIPPASRRWRPADGAPPRRGQTPQSGSGLERRRWPASPASATRAGPRTARRPTGNAHPHATDKVAIVHNGIIENFRALREELTKAGHKFESETDSEVIAHLISADYLDKGQRPSKRRSAPCAASKARSDRLLVRRPRRHADRRAQRQPAAVWPWRWRELSGFGRDRRLAVHDARDLSGRRRHRCSLAHQDQESSTRRIMWSSARSHIFRRCGGGGKRQSPPLHAEGNLRAAGNHGRTIARYVNAFDEKVEMPDLDGVDLAADSAIVIGCGTAHYAGRVAEYWLEQIAGIRWKPTSRRNSAIASRPSAKRHSRCSCRNRAKPPTRWRRCAIAKRRAEDARRRQRAGEHDLARSRCAPADAGWAGNWRRVHQGVHRAAFSAGGADDRRWPRARQFVEPGRKPLVRALMETPRLIADALAASRRSRRSRSSSARRATCSISAAACTTRSRSKAR
jgi:hypothetical protein